MTFTAPINNAQEIPKAMERAAAWCKPWSGLGIG